jgi:hypothetical protein
VQIIVARDLRRRLSGGEAAVDLKDASSADNSYTIYS